MEYIYYRELFLLKEKRKNENKESLLTSLFKEFSQLIEHYNFQISDLKFLLFDISTCVRGIGGVKQTLNANQLPSYQKYRNDQFISKENESEEERKQRHLNFFKELKETFKK